MTLQPRRSLSKHRRHGKTGKHLALSGALIAYGLLLGGCASQSRVTARPEYILAARCDLGESARLGPVERARKLWIDLQRLKSLGFNAVLFDYLEDAQRVDYLDAATRCGLHAYITDRDLHYYLLTGKLRGADNLDALVRAKLKPLASHSSFSGVAILSGYSKDRAAAAIAALESAGIKCLVPGQSGYQAHHGALVAWLDANDLSNPNVSQIERLLLELNGEVYAGWNDGLVIDFTPDNDASPVSELIRPLDSDSIEKTESARTVGAAAPSPPQTQGRGEGKEILFPLATNDESEPSANDPVLPASNPRSRLFAVESLLGRANLWGARLQGFDRQLIPSDGLRRDPALLTAVFVRDARRYLFLSNQSSQAIRGPIRFPAVLAGKPVARAVGIPATADRIAGDVFVTHGAEVSVTVNLRPGDAALFELF